MYYPGVLSSSSDARAIALRIFSEFTRLPSVKYGEIS